MPVAIEDYGLIGDCHTAALIGADGSIDWLCLPRFDSDACFAALLGRPEHGRFLLSPASGVRRVRRRYQPGTLILETEMTSDGGAVRLIDFMPLSGEQHDLVRIVEGIEGEVAMRAELVIRFGYGASIPWVRTVEGGLRATAGPDTVLVKTPVPLRGEGFSTVADFPVRAGQRVPFIMTWCRTYGPPPERIDAEAALAATAAWWQEWIGRCTYRGEWRDAVDRSLITLKALTFAPSGGIVAAPTTSLPELLGGERNWDYRYTWLRDATFTLYALLMNGYRAEAEAWREWLVNAVAGHPGAAQALYGIEGERRVDERVIDWLPGYAGSLPVRVGNAASRQHQLDVYGEVMDSLHLARRSGLAPNENAWRVQRAILDFLESDWRKPDEGIWEIRGPRRQFTHSKVMAWVAFDRAATAVARFGAPGDAGHWRSLADEVHEEVCRRGFDAGLGAFVQSYGSTAADASLLMLPLVGFLPASDPRIAGTVRHIERTLVHDGLVRRYLTDPELDGLPPGEGFFFLCSFWLADNLALLGRGEEARRLFERLLSLRNDVGLLSEEYDPQLTRMLGNFPQAFSHIGLVNTARNLCAPQPAPRPAEDRPAG
jgi:GH15 family glucan-1,4-alpha-glucosidase